MLSARRLLEMLPRFLNDDDFSAIEHEKQTISCRRQRLVDYSIERFFCADNTIAILPLIQDTSRSFPAFSRMSIAYTLHLTGHFHSPHTPSPEETSH